MARYNVNYTEQVGNDETAKRRTALSDIRSYLGPKQYKKLTAEFRKESKLSLEQFASQLGLFLGIEGYPVIVWYEEIWQ